MTLLPLLLACAPPALEVRVTPDGSGVTASANLPLDRVELVDARGRRVASRGVEPPAPTTSVRAPLTSGDWEIRAFAGDQQASARFGVADPGPFDVRIEAPPGQDGSPEGAPVDVPIGGTAPVALVVTAHLDGPVRWEAGQADGDVVLAAGERAVIPVELGGDVLDVRLRHGSGAERVVRLEPRPVDRAVLLASLGVGRPMAPARPDGSVDPTVPAQRLALPAPWWDATLDRLGLGFRPRDDLAPRTHVAVPVTNRGDRPVNASVALQVLGSDGRPHPAFRPRLRDAPDLTAVRRLIRVEPGRTVSAALPLYLDRRGVPDTTSVRLVAEVRPLGAREGTEVRADLVVDRGTPWASAVLVLASGAMVAGWAGLVWGLPVLMRRPIRELTTVAMFASLSFTVGVASQVLGLGLGSVLGPFAPFVLGLADDAVRMCLLGTLLTRVPRPGTFALAAVVGWLMRALAVGALHPVDLLYLGGTVALTEGLLWVAGITRGRGWIRGSAWSRWARLTLGLAVSNALAVAVSLAVSVVFYRLYVAPWYVAALIAGPGLIYASIGCALAVPFADGLRRIG